MSSVKEAHKRKRDEELTEHKSPSTGGRRRQAKRAKFSGNGENASRLAGSDNVKDKASRNGPLALVELEVSPSSGGVVEKISGITKRKRNREYKDDEHPHRTPNKAQSTAKQLVEPGIKAGNTGQHEVQSKENLQGQKHKRKQAAKRPVDASNPNGDLVQQIVGVTQISDDGQSELKQVEYPEKKPKEGSTVTTSGGADLMKGGRSVRDNNAKRISTKKRRQERAANEQQGLEYNPYRLKSVVGDTVVVPRVSHHLKGAPWTVSEPLGGTFITAPLLTPDEKYIVFATQFAACVFSTSTSLLEHSCPAGLSGCITTLALSAASPYVLYVGHATGHVITWNVESGEKLNRWNINTQVVDLECATVVNPSQDTVYMIEKSKKQWMITAHQFGLDNDPSRTQLVTLLKYDKPIRSLKVLESGRAIIAMTTNGLIVGRLAGNKTALKNISYIWRDITCKEPPTCFDVKSAESFQAPTINVVVGGLKGCIFLYQDLFTFLRMEDLPGRSVEQSPSKNAQELHWHREAVGAVAWSRDGNYIISGGKETVLVLWQLETGKKQFLPHLESPIQDLIVSPRRASYAIHLGDNSVMVLSTSELTPTANLAGLQSLSLPSRRSYQAQLPTLELRSKFSLEDVQTSVPSVIHPQNANQILLAVPAYQCSTDSTGTAPAPYLQTFDVSASRHVSRQALTRTNATSTNLGPEGNRILEPDIHHLQVSHNGRWLASVEEWRPRPEDFEDLAVDKEDLLDEVEKHREIYLKLWSWDVEAKIWKLNGRIEAPHILENSHTSGRVLDLAVNPFTTEFATVGEDSVVRIWAPKTKLFDGLVHRGELNPNRKLNGPSTTWWTLRYAVPLERATARDSWQSLRPKRAALAYSNDGSCLVAHQHFGGAHNQSNGLVHFIDTDSGRKFDRRSNMYTDDDDIHAMAFIEQYLICVGRTAAVIWDVTTFKQHAYIPLATKNGPAPPKLGYQNTMDQRSQGPQPHLAINLPTSTFCIATPEATYSLPPHTNPLLHYRTRLRIFSPTASPLNNNMPSTPLFEAALPRAAVSLMSAGGVQGQDPTKPWNVPITGEKGYVVLDCGAVITFIRPSGGGTRKSPAVLEPDTTTINGDVMLIDDDDEGTLATSPTSPLIPSTEPENGTEPESQNPRNAYNQPDNEFARMFAAASTDRPVVRPEQLADVFDHPPLLPPPMLDMFNGVIRLFAGGGGGGGAKLAADRGAEARGTL